MAHGIYIRENWLRRFDTARVLKAPNDTPFFVHVLNCECTMRSFVFFALAVLISVHCSEDLNSVSLEAGENVDYQSYQDLDAFLSEECEKHEEYSECSGDPTCRKTCENMDRWETMTCVRTKICIRGCVCEDGYVRDDRDVCVKETNCPRI